MTRTDLINVVASEAELSKKQAEAAVNSALGAIIAALKDGNKVQLNGFGTFEVKESPAREGRNPRTNETIQISASKKPVFSASKSFKEEINI